MESGFVRGLSPTLSRSGASERKRSGHTQWYGRDRNSSLSSGARAAPAIFGGRPDFLGSTAAREQEKEVA